MTTQDAGGRGSVEFPLDAREMFSHYVLYGAGALCEAAGVTDVRLRWTTGMRPQPVLSGDGLDAEQLGGIALAHAQRCAATGSWLHEPLPGDAKRALMSPRIGAVGDAQDRWEALMGARWNLEASLEETGDLLSLALIGSLGQPSWWRFTPQRQRLQDDGASRLEMQPRNQGSEFIGTKLRALAAAVAGRTVQHVADGLVGSVLVDDLGKGAADSRTATNLRPLGPTDSAQAWVALWGISQVPLAHQTRARSATATHVVGAGTTRHGAFVLPLWTGEWRPAKLRALLAGRALQEAGDLVVNGGAVTAPAQTALKALRKVRGVGALVTFRVEEFGSISAPERRALRGQVVPTPASASSSGPGRPIHHHDE